MSSFSSSVFPSLLFSFNLKDIAQEAYNQHRSLTENKLQKQISKYKLIDLFTDEGLNLCQLFGFYLSKKIKFQSLKSIALQRKLVFIDYNDFQKLVINTWGNIGSFSIILPALFQLCKSSLGGFINMKHIDQFANICKGSIKDEFIADIKYRISPQNIKKIHKNVYQLAQKQDIMNSGFVEKSKIISIFAQSVPRNVMKEIDFSKISNELIQNDLLNYQMLFSEQYLMSGVKVKQFLLGFCARKITKVIKTLIKRKKQNSLKNQFKKSIKSEQKLFGSASLKKNQKLLKIQQKKEAIITSLHQKDNKQADELKKHKYMNAKELLIELIFNSVEIGEKFFVQDEKSLQKQMDESVNKSVFTVDPVVSQDLFQNVFQEQLQIKRMSQGIGFFISNDQGFSFQMSNIVQMNNQRDNQNASKLNKINLSISTLIKKSKILDYQIHNQKLYLIRQDGLFYMWNFQIQKDKKDCYQSMIQTSFKNCQIESLLNYRKHLSKSTKKRISKKKKIIAIDTETNIISINCSNDLTSPCLELYDSSLNYLGKISLDKATLSFNYDHVAEAQFFLSKISKNFKSDYVIKSKLQYSQILLDYHWNSYASNKKQLIGYYVLEQFQALGGAQIQFFQEYYKFLTSNKSQNKIPLNQNWYEEIMEFKKEALSFSKVSSEVLDYLNQLNYIKNIKEQDLRKFVNQNVFLCIKDRKTHLLTLFQDNYAIFQDLVNSNNTGLISKNILFNLLKQCDITEQQSERICQSYKSTPDNFIDIFSFIHSQHTCRIIDQKQNKYSSNKKLKVLVLPSVQICSLFTVFKLGVAIFSVKQGNNKRKIFVINFKGQLVNQIHFNISASETIHFTCVRQSGYLMCLKKNDILIYSLSSLAVSSSDIRPVRIIQNLQIPKNLQVISFNYSYIQNSLLILSAQSFLVYDFQELNQTKSKNKKFRIKPGYIAVFIKDDLNSSVQAHQIKRKYLTNSNQQNFDILISPTKFGQNVVTIVSVVKNSSHLHIKSFYLSKNYLKTTKDHISKPLPIKLFKQLQSRIKRNYYQDHQLPIKHPSQDQRILSNDVASYLKKKIRQMNDQDSLLQKQGNDGNQNKYKARKFQAISMLNNIYGLLTNTKSLIAAAKGDNYAIPERQLKLKFLLTIMLSQSESELQQVINKQFLNLYRHSSLDSFEANKKQMINDLATSQQKKLLERLIYFCSLIDKFLLSNVSQISNSVQKRSALAQILGNSLKGSSLNVNKIVQLICVNHQIKLDFEKNQSFGLQKLQKSTIKMSSSMKRSEKVNIQIPSSNLVKSTFMSLIQLQNLGLGKSLDFILKILQFYIPTKYKYICPRYYKQLLQTQSPLRNSAGGKLEKKIEQKQFFLNNFSSNDLIEENKFVFQNILNQTNQNILKIGLKQHLINKKFYTVYKNEIERKYPEVKRNYRKLIQILFSYKIINTLEMIFLITRQKPIFVQNDGQEPSLNQQKPSQNHQIDFIMEQISDKIASNKIQLPKPYLTFQYFKQNIYQKGDSQFIFSKYFNKTNLQSNQILTRNFHPILNASIQKNVSLQYIYEKWRQTVGQKIIPLISYSSQLQQQFSKITFLKFDRFKDSIQSHTETDLKQLTILCLIASLPNTERGKKLKKQVLEKPQQFYVSLQPFLKYLNDFKRQFFSKAFKQVKQKSVSDKQGKFNQQEFQAAINIPIYHLVRILWNSGNLLNKQQLLLLASYSINEIKLKDINSWIDSLVKQIQSSIAEKQQFPNNSKLKPIETQQLKLTETQSKRPTEIQQKKPHLIDPFDLKIVIRTLQKNFYLTYQAIAWKLFQTHDTLDFAKHFTTKSVAIEGNISVNQIYKYFECESIVRWMFRIKYQRFLNLTDVQKVLKYLTNVICQKIWNYNLLLWGQKNNLILSLLSSFCSNTSQKQTNVKKKIKFSLLSKYFLIPQKSLVQQAPHWTTVLKYIYGKFKYVHSYAKLQANQQQQINAVSFLKSLKNQFENVSYRHQFDAEDVQLQEFYQCISWALSQKHLNAEHILRQNLAASDSFISFEKMQNIIMLTQPQQLTLTSKHQVSSLVPALNIKFPPQYLLTPEILNQLFVTEQISLILPEKISFSQFFNLKKCLSQQTSSIGIQNIKLISDLSPIQKHLLKQLYKAILDNPSHQNNTLSQFYDQMKYQNFQKSPQKKSQGKIQQNISKKNAFLELFKKQKDQVNQDQKREKTENDKIFPQFYSKIKNFHRSLSKLNSYDLSIMFSLLKQQNQKEAKASHLLSYYKLFYYSSTFISQAVKKSWIINYVETMKQIEFFTNNNRSQEQIEQKMTYLKIYSELILCNCWDEPMSSVVDKQQVSKTLQLLTVPFNYQIYLYQKWFSSEFPLTKQNISILIKINDKKQFTSAFKKIFNNQPTQTQANSIWQYFNKNRDQILNSYKKSQTQNISKIKSNKNLILSQCIRFLTSQQKVKNHNLFPQTLLASKNQFKLLSQYFNQYLQFRSFKQCYVTYETLIKKTHLLIEQLMVEEIFLRIVTKNIFKKLLNQTHIQIQTLYFSVLRINSRDESSQNIEMSNDKLKLIIEGLIYSKQEQLRKCQILNDVVLSKQQKKLFLNLVIQIFIKYDQKGMQRPNGLTIEEFKKQILDLRIDLESQTEPNISVQKQNNIVHKEVRGQTLNRDNYEQIHKQLDIMGVGQVNLNDIKLSKNYLFKRLQRMETKNKPSSAKQAKPVKQALSPRQTRYDSSYIKISEYLQLKHPHLNKKIGYLKPNSSLTSNSQVITKELLSQQEVSNYSSRIKVVSSQKMLKILSPYTDQQHLEFIISFFNTNKLFNYPQFNSIIVPSETQNLKQSSANDYSYVQKASNYINLPKLINYIQGSQDDHAQKSTKSNQNLLTGLAKQALQVLISWIQAEGGVYRIINGQNQLLKSALKNVVLSCPQANVKYKFDNYGDLIIDVIKELLKQIIKAFPSDQHHFHLLKQLNLFSSRIIQSIKSSFSFYQPQRKLLFSKKPFTDLNKSISSPLITSLTSILDFYYNDTLALNTTSNEHVQRLKQLSLSKYKLLQKLYVSCSKEIDQATNQVKIKSKYDIFEQLIDTSLKQQNESAQNQNSTKKTFELLDFWLFINSHSQISYSKLQIDQIFRIIDANNDKDISFREFVSFWMAVEQVLPQSLVLSNTDKSNIETPLQKMKFQLRKLFVFIFQKQINSSNTKNIIKYSSILKLFNTSNKQKIKKLIQIVFEDKNNDNSNANILQNHEGKGLGKTIIFNNNLEVTLDMDRLKIIKRVIDQSEKNKILRVKNQKQQGLGTVSAKNLILEWVSQDLHDFILGKIVKKNKRQEEDVKILKVQLLIKYVLSKYPSIGYSIIQALYQSSHKKFEANELLSLLKDLIKFAKEWKSIANDNNFGSYVQSSKQLRSQIYSTIKAGDSIAKTFHFMIQNKVSHFYGSSISFRLKFKTISEEANLIQRQIKQIENWIIEQSWNQESILPLICGAKEKIQILPAITVQNQDKKIKQKQMIARYQQQILAQLIQVPPQEILKQVVVEDKSRLSGKIKSALKKIKIKDHYFSYTQQSIALQQDTRFKSKNLASLALNILMYCDDQVSIGGIVDLQSLIKCKGQQMNYYGNIGDNKKYSPILSLKRPLFQSFKCINSLIKIAELNYIIHKKYKTVGLFCNLQNIFCSFQNETNFIQFRLKHFYSGVNLASDGNYAEGFDLLNFYQSEENLNKILPLAPQIDESIYTYAADSYNFGYLTYILLTGESIQELISNQIKFKQALNNNKNLMQPSMYQTHSYINKKVIQTIKVIKKKLSNRNHQENISHLEVQLLLFTLIYRCTVYNWYERPQMHQILQALNKIKSLSLILNQNDCEFFRFFNEEQKFLSSFESKNFNELSQQIKVIENIETQRAESKHVWTIQGLEKLKQLIQINSTVQTIQKLLIIQLYEFFNKKTIDYLQDLNKSSNIVFLNQNSNQFKLLSSLNKAGSNFQPSQSINFKSKLFDSPSPNKKSRSPIKMISERKSVLLKSFNSQLSPKKRQSQKISGNQTFLQSQSKLYLQKSGLYDNINQITSQNKIDQPTAEKIEKILNLVVGHASQAKIKSSLSISLCLFKQVLNDELVKKYTTYCDQKWKVSSFDILKKIQQINLVNKIQNLPKNGYFYNDLYQLMQQKITLNLISQQNSQQESNKKQNQKIIQHQSSKLLALNHILSILVSNNLSRLLALHQSKIIESLYVFLSSQDQEIKSKVIKIYNLISKSLQFSDLYKKSKSKFKGQLKKIDEVYKTMMVIYDQLQIKSGSENKQLSPKKKQDKNNKINQSPSKSNKKSAAKSAPVVNLLSYVQNFYTLAGQESVRLIQIICVQQMCHLFSLINLCEIIYTERKNKQHVEILANLTGNEKIYFNLKSPLVGIFTPLKLKMLEKNGLWWTQISSNIKLWQDDSNLLIISNQLSVVKGNYEKQYTQKVVKQIKECIQNNFYYYKILKSKAKQLSTFQGSQIAEYNSFYIHFEALLKFIQKIIWKMIQQNQQNISNQKNSGKSQTTALLQTILKYLQVTIQEWVHHQNIIKVLIQILNSIFNKQVEQLYLPDQKQENCITLLLQITQYLTVEQPVFMINNGFIHFYNNIMRKQYARMELFFIKKVQKTRLLPVYSRQAQWRLTILNSLLNGPNISVQIKKQISKELSNLQLAKYLFEFLFVNQTVMDLRYYQSFQQIVPYRFCRPFKSQALAMIGILIKDTRKGQILKIGVQGDCSSRIISFIKPLTQDLKEFFAQNGNSVFSKKIKNNELDLLNAVQTIWLFSEISQSSDQRLKYQFINSGAHEAMQTLLDKYKSIRKLFPKLKKVVVSNNMLTNSKVFQKSQLYASQRIM